MQLSIIPSNNGIILLIEYTNILRIRNDFGVFIAYSHEEIS